MSVEAVYIFFPAVLVLLAVAGSFFSTRLELKAEERKAKTTPKIGSPLNFVPAPAASTVVPKPVHVFADDPLQAGSVPDERAKQLAALILKSGKVVVADAEPTVENSTELEKFQSYYSKKLQVQPLGRPGFAKRDYRIMRPKRKIWLRKSK